MATIDETTNADAELAALLDEQVDREVDRRIAEAVAAVDFGRPGYRRRGRNDRYPFVPVVLTDHESGVGRRQRQPLAKAFATADEALAYADRVIEAERAALTDKLGQPRFRALRAHHGLPYELAELRADVAAGR
jgi:hypothetical protein